MDGCWKSPVRDELCAASMFDIFELSEGRTNAYVNDYSRHKEWSNSAIDIDVPVKLSNLNELPNIITTYLEKVTDITFNPIDNNVETIFEESSEDYVISKRRLIKDEEDLTDSVIEQKKRTGDTSCNKVTSPKIFISNINADIRYGIIKIKTICSDEVNYDKTSYEGTLKIYKKGIVYVIRVSVDPKDSTMWHEIIAGMNLITIEPHDCAEELENKLNTRPYITEDLFVDLGVEEYVFNPKVNLSSAKLEITVFSYNEYSDAIFNIHHFKTFKSPDARLDISIDAKTPCLTNWKRAMTFLTIIILFHPLKTAKLNLE